MDPLKKKFADKSAALKTKIKAMLKEKGAIKVDEVTLKQVFAKEEKNLFQKRYSG